jgi:hypothetical protein
MDQFPQMYSLAQYSQKGKLDTSLHLCQHSDIETKVSKGSNRTFAAWTTNGGKGPEADLCIFGGFGK